MLVLSRGIGETTIMGNGSSVPFMDVTVLGISNGQVRLGFEAPKNVPINRQEIHNRILAEKNSQDTNTYSKSQEQE